MCPYPDFINVSARHMRSKFTIRFFASVSATCGTFRISRTSHWRAPHANPVSSTDAAPYALLRLLFGIAFSFFSSSLLAQCPTGVRCVPMTQRTPPDDRFTPSLSWILGTLNGTTYGSGEVCFPAPGPAVDACFNPSGFEYGCTDSGWNTATNHTTSAAAAASIDATFGPPNYPGILGANAGGAGTAPTWNLSEGNQSYARFGNVSAAYAYGRLVYVSTLSAMHDEFNAYCWVGSVSEYKGAVGCPGGYDRLSPSTVAGLCVPNGGPNLEKNAVVTRESKLPEIR